MDLTSSALTTVFIALIYALIRVVNFFISKKNGTTKASTVSDLEHTIKEIHKRVEHLDELHSVYDSNHVPTWYIPGDLFPLIRQIQTDLASLEKEFGGVVEEIKNSTNTDSKEMADLTNSHKLMIERLGDFFSRINSIVQR